MNYFDASALVKRFVTEQGSPLVQHLVTRDRAATGKVAHTEVHAALARKRREGFVSLRDYSLACRQFDRDWRSYVLVELHDEILTIARGLVRRHPLRGVDAIHLASALSLARSLDARIAFIAADERLLRAAKAEHLQAVDVEHERP